MSTKTKDEVKEVTTENSKKIKKPKEIYYFYTQGCGWCKRTEPLIDELVKEGHNILKLDLADADNKKIEAQLKSKYKKPFDPSKYTILIKCMGFLKNKANDAPNEVTINVNIVA